MDKIKYLIIGVLFLFSIGFVSADNITCYGGEQLVGDVNYDGMITFEDSVLIAQYFNGMIELIGNETCCADVNNDNNITIEDAELIVNFSIGFNTCFIGGYSCNLMENCTDNIDNDCDGLIDLNDSDCHEPISCFGGNQLVGDINNDGMITFEDSVLISWASVGLVPFTGEEMCCIDVNNDNTITFDDIIMVTNFIVGNSYCFNRGYSCNLVENCSDGIDNDCNTLVDYDDDTCEIIVPAPSVSSGGSSGGSSSSSGSSNAKYDYPFVSGTDCNYDSQCLETQECVKVEGKIYKQCVEAEITETTNVGGGVTEDIIEELIEEPVVEEPIVEEIIEDNNYYTFIYILIGVVILGFSCYFIFRKPKEEDIEDDFENQEEKDG